MIEKLLVCLDGYPLAEKILPYAIEQAIHFGSKVVLLHVVVIPGRPLPGKAELAPAEGQLAPKEEGKTAKYLDSVSHLFVEKGIEVERAIVETSGEPGEAIITYAVKNEIDLIAMAHLSPPQ